MSNNKPSFRLPFAFPEDVHQSVKAALRLTYQKCLDLDQAIVELVPKVGASGTTVQNITQQVTQVSGGGGGGTTPSFGSVNLQPNLTPGAYTLAQGDLAGLILVQSAIAFALTLNSGLMTPFFTTVYNFGSATITATPSLGTVNNVGSVTVKPGQFSIFYFDANGEWWDVFSILAQTSAPVAGQFLASYDATTGLFTTAAANTASFADAEVPPEIVDGIRTTFTLLHSPNPVLSVEGYDNGVLQYPTLSFTVAANIVTFLVPPIAGHSLIFWYRY